jgi:hypothetical protein
VRVGRQQVRERGRAQHGLVDAGQQRHVCTEETELGEPKVEAEVGRERLVCGRVEAQVAGVGRLLRGAADAFVRRVGQRAAALAGHSEA